MLYTARQGYDRKSVVDMNATDKWLLVEIWFLYVTWNIVDNQQYES